MSEEYETVPIRQSTVDEMLRAMHELSGDVRECVSRIGNLETEVRLYKDKVDSDIKALKTGDRDAFKSVTDLREELRKEEIAKLKESRAIWVKWVVGIGTLLLTTFLGGLVGRFVAK